jgi:integrase
MSLIFSLLGSLSIRPTLAGLGGISNAPRRAPRKANKSARVIGKVTVLLDFACADAARLARLDKTVECSFPLANAGHDTREIQDWLGHRSMQRTVRYTELTPTRFRDFWRAP